MTWRPPPPLSLSSERAEVSRLAHIYLPHPSLPPSEVVGVASVDLVPGDVLAVPGSGLTLPCDAALLTGHAIVNEAMLTGTWLTGCVL